MSTPDLNVKERQSASELPGKKEDGLLFQLVGDVSGLVRSELLLAKSEVSQSVTDDKTGFVSLAIGAVFLIPGITLLIASIVMVVEAFTDLAMWSSTLLVGVVVSIVGAILLMSAKSKLSADNVMPSRTQATLRKDAELVEKKLS